MSKRQEINEKIFARIDELEPETIRHRRYLHMHPETGENTANTERYIKDFLKECEIKVIDSPIGVLGMIEGEKHEEIYALRADLDALPVNEESDVEYKSLNEGVMHACGHDGHVAMLLTAAKVLKENQNLLENDILLIFQPLEEGPGSGGKIIAESLNKMDLGKKIKGVSAFHLSNEFEKGTIAAKYGSSMGSTDDINLTIKGKGGHAGMPHLAVDAISVGAKIILQIESFIAKSINPMDSFVFSFGTFYAGEWRASIAERAELQGTMRCLSEETRNYAKKGIKRIVQGICEANNCDYDLEIKEDVPVLVTDEKALSRNLELFEQLIDPKNIIVQSTARMAAEDFSYFGNYWPISFIWLGAGNREEGLTAELHNTKFDFDENALTIGAKLHCLSAIGGGK